MIDWKDIQQALSRQDLYPEERQYFDFHKRRLSYLLDLVQHYRNLFDAKTVLDVGPHFLTVCLGRYIQPEIAVSTAGWDYPLIPAGRYKEHLALDLNTCQGRDAGAHAGKFDIVVVAEIIEHLYTSPIHLFRYLKTLLKPETGVMVVQTPNAVSLSKRLAIMAGRNPFEMIRETLGNPGHFREYTMDELIAFGEATGLRVDQMQYCDYWQSGNVVLRQLEKAYPPFRRGLTVCFRN